MGSIERSKNSFQLWKKVAIQFLLSFAMGFLVGIVPTGPSLFLIQSNSYQSTNNLNVSLASQMPPKSLKESTPPPMEEEDDDDTHLIPRNLLIIITTISPSYRFNEPFLRRLGHTLKLVSSPLLWIVVEAHNDDHWTDDLLRRRGIMYRHLTYKENFTDVNAEADHQRNVALNHIENYRFNGIVHFADVSNVYDIEFLEEMREINVFGAWPVAMLSANRKRVVVEGPICKSSNVVGWQVKELNNGTEGRRSSTSNEEDGNGNTETRPGRINLSSFAFNSSILWDPERWGRPSSTLDTSQDSIKFVQEVVLEDETKLKAIPADCSQIGLWHLHVTRTFIHSPK